MFALDSVLTATGNPQPPLVRVVAKFGFLPDLHALLINEIKRLQIYKPTLNAELRGSGVGRGK
jgi:hypothetical protein